MNRTVFRNNHKRLNYFRFVLHCVILQLIVSTVPAQLRREPQISSQFTDSSAIARTYFASPSIIKARKPVHFRFGGGVVPRSTVQFQDPAEKKLNINELKLMIRNKEQLSNSISEYDTFGIEWKGKVYNLYAQDDLVLPLLKFIKRESFIAFTYPRFGMDKNYSREYGLVPLPDGEHFVAKEFSSESHSEFLYEVDYFPSEYLETIPNDKAILIKKDLNWGKGISDITGLGTYVNADFHVLYKAYLTEPKDKNKDNNIVEISGLPLRYYLVFRVRKQQLLGILKYLSSRRRE